jgi:hypothetical protein
MNPNNEVIMLNKILPNATRFFGGYATNRTNHYFNGGS